MQRTTVHNGAAISLQVFQTSKGTFSGKATIAGPNPARLSVAGFGSEAEAEQELLAIARLEIDNLKD
jgi:hypothetical protein